MAENWTFYPLLVDGEPASIFVDVGIASAAPVAGFDQMAYLRIRMLEPRDEGLSSQEEYDALVALEEAVTGAVTAGGRAIYVGRNTSGGHRDLYFYVEGSSFEQDVRTAMSDWPHYQYQTGSRADPEWSTYRNFLYPSPNEFQRIGNRSVIHHLVERGDDLDQPRTIDHFAFFNEESGRDGFVRFLTQSGFSVAQASDSIGGKLQVAFYRIDSPNDIDSITIDLRRAAEQNGGDYDGWGCPVTGEEVPPTVSRKIAKLFGGFLGKAE